MKAVNYKVGALKRRFKLGRADQEPGTFINKSNQNKSVPTQKDGVTPTLEVAIRGLV